jgi:hypothetical protein
MAHDWLNSGVLGTRAASDGAVTSPYAGTADWSNHVHQHHYLDDFHLCHHHRFSGTREFCPHTGHVSGHCGSGYGGSGKRDRDYPVHAQRPAALWLDSKESLQLEGLVQIVMARMRF